MKYALFLLCFFGGGFHPKAVAQSPKYEVGCQSFEWQDAQRTDPYDGSKRVINVRVWYPVEGAQVKGKKYPIAPYYDGLGQVVHKLNWSAKKARELRSFKTRGLINAPIASTGGRFPLLIFSPSLGGNLSLYTYYAERLAQKGFIVAGVNHLYESECVLYKKQVIPSRVDFYDSLKTLKIPDQITAEGYRLARDKRLRVLGQDLSFCLNQLLKQNNITFAGKINLTKVGVWGHSIGGAAAVFAAYLDPRFLAVVNLDGTPPGIALQQGIKTPFMFIEDLTDYKNHRGYAKLHQRRSDFCRKINAKSYRLLIANIHHNSFLDIYYRRAKGKAHQSRHLKPLQVTAGLMEQFFAHYLKGKSLGWKPQKTDALEVMVFDK
jgi:predicted dienelactone hydrolase